MTHCVQKAGSCGLSLLQQHAGEEEEEEEEGRPVSPPPCHLAPILVPSSAPSPSCFQSSNSPLHPQQSEVDPEERRRRRNREASRRYRERARGDPELLRRMREQQNRWAITHYGFLPLYEIKLFHRFPPQATEEILRPFEREEARPITRQLHVRRQFLLMEVCRGTIACLSSSWREF